jgi:next-to-BRCA1 protein 1
MVSQGVTASPVQTIIDVQPTEPVAPVKVEEKQEMIKPEQAEVEAAAALENIPAAPTAEDLVAIYERDTVADGTVVPPNHVFEQTWVLRNAGTIPWPAGCSVKFVGGDYMGHVDPKHPAGIHELVSASESTVCYEPLAPGQEFPFTVLLRTPVREGKVISYWRLTTQDGIKFGNRLWCDVEVQAPKPKEEPKEELKVVATPLVEEAKEEIPAPKAEESQMIFPKLEKESPVSSIHEESKHELEPVVKNESEQEVDDFEDCMAEDDEWAEDNSEDGFMTDEEYDILDASDEEYLEEQQQKLLKK